MDELVSKHKDIQIKILEFIDNESNNENDTTALLNYLINMDLKIYEIEPFLQFISIISCYHHRNSYFFIKIKQIIDFYKPIIKENFSSSHLSHIFRKNKQLMLYFYQEQLINIDDLVIVAQKSSISDFFYPEIESNIFKLIKNKEVIEIIINNLKYYLKYKKNEMDNYPLLTTFLHGKVNQDSDSFVMNKIKSFLEKSIDNKIKELSLFFILYTEKNFLEQIKRKGLDYLLQFYLNSNEINTANILEVFSSRLYAFNNISGRNPILDDVNNNDVSYNIFFNSCFMKSTINKFLQNEKHIYKMFFNFIKKILSKKGNKYINLYIGINKFFNEVSDDSYEDDEDQNENDSNENNENQNDLNDDEEECFEYNLLYQKMYPKIKEFVDDVISQKNSIKEFEYQQISSKVISFYDEMFDYELEYEFNKLFEPCFNHNIKQDESFEENRRKGENDSYICQLIRNDSIEEFVSYTNRMNYSLTKSIIPSSIFETNSFLLNKITSLIEYAAFFGSIQIFQYLLLNGVELRPKLWLYAIYGRNAEIIHLIEDNHVQPNDETYSECLFNSIKCYHNEIAHYIQDNLYEKKNQDNVNRLFLAVLIHPSDDMKKFNINDDAFSLKIFKTFNIEFYSLILPSHLNENSSYFKNDWIMLYFLFVLWINDEKIKPLILKIASRKKIFASFIDYILLNSTEIEPNAFQFSLIQKISIPNSIKLINMEAFYESEKLTEVIIPSSVIEIRDRAFYDCYSLQKVVLSPSIKKIGNFVFSHCNSLKQIIIPSSVTHIGDYAFNRCTSLSFISIPSSVISIGKYAFRMCKSLEKITIPSPLAKIGENAFIQSSLKYALITSSNKSIENNVFPPQTYIIQIVYSIYNN